ncbi:hypothetical protein ACQEVB_16700 [Pseudonocardia sp. CA-107938]|uniref:hypothetical protein n=1 Tax=Pseudonocardia sp. CA-107938 TaxID=3240021 RepID=UPI003D8F236E
MSGFGRVAASSSVLAGIAAAGANALLVAYLVLQFLRPGDVSTSLGPLAGGLGALGAALLIPVAVALGEGLLAVLGVAAMVVLAVAWALVAGQVLTLWAAAPVVAGAATLLACWLVVVNDRTERLPPHLIRFGRRSGAAAFAGSLVIVLALALLPPMSTVQLGALAVGGVPAGLAWLAVPAWSISVGRALGRAPTAEQPG